jgi:peroxiredoxin family protein
MDLGRLEKMEAKIVELEERLRVTEGKESVSIVVFSGEWDKLFAAFTIANGALALGKEVHMFFTFWGSTALRQADSPGGTNQNFSQWVLNAILPKCADKTPLSRMNLFGMGRFFVKKLAKEKGVDTLPQLIHDAEDLGAKMHCCDTSMQLFGWDCASLRQGDASSLCGVASFLSEAMQSKTTLFI